MDRIMITGAVILLVIAAIEIVSIFFSLPKRYAPPYAAVMPVFADDDNFVQRLEYIMQKGCGRRNIIIVDYSATAEQSELCSRFVRDNPDAVFISHEQLTENFRKFFTISEK